MSTEISNTILDHIGDGILAVDSSLRVVFANNVACSILRIESASVIGKHVDHIMQLTLKHDNVESKISPFLITVSNGKSETYSKPMLVTSIIDEQVYIEDSVSPILNADKDVIGAVMTFRDVSEEVRMIEMLKLANQRYKILFDSIRSGVAVYQSSDGIIFTIVDLNPSAEKIEDINKIDILGKNVEKVFPGIAQLGLLDAMKRTWKTGNSERIPCAMYNDSLRSGWRDNYVYKLPSGEIIVVYEDVSNKRSKAEKISDAVEKLRENETRLRGMFENSGVGMIVIDGSPNFKIKQANRAFCDFIGYTKAELIGMTIESITDPKDWKNSFYQNNLANSLPPASDAVRFVKRYIRKDGTIRWGSIFLTKVEYDDGRIEHFAQVIDITDRKRAEDERELLTKVVEELNASDVKNRDTIRNIMFKIKDFVGLDSVAVRLPERIGIENQITDYPFYYHEGFDNQFISDEKYLYCEHPEDKTSNCLACICGAVISGKFDKNKSFFTKNGSFWTNATSALAKSEIDFDTVVISPRKACWERGYESMAVIPITSSGVIVGSMLLNAYRTNVFDDKMIEFLEELGKSMGVAFSRMQLRSDIDEHRKALARANDILEIEGDFARNIADESSSSLESVLIKAGKKLNMKWLGVAVIGESGIIGRWTDERNSSTASFVEDILIEAKDAMEIRKWANTREIYTGERSGMPTCLTKISKDIDGSWMAIPVLSDKTTNSVGVVMMVSKTSVKWSKSERDAMMGFATLLCILTKAEKNRIELKRKIEETILNISQSVSFPSLEVRC